MQNIQTNQQPPCVFATQVASALQISSICIFLQSGMGSYPGRHPLSTKGTVARAHDTFRGPQKCFHFFQNQKEKMNFDSSSLFVEGAHNSNVLLIDLLLVENVSYETLLESYSSPDCRILWHS